jgi:glycosyltransferase involved in cell wall biosynthesis/Tfp pilus assembly protein PilF
LSYFSKGLYAKQLKWFFKKFSTQNFYIYLLDEYIDDPDKIIREICRFLNVDPALASLKVDIKLNAQSNHSFLQKTKENLMLKYDSSIIELEQLLKRDLGIWKLNGKLNSNCSNNEGIEHKSYMKRPIFIVGSPRSGTTLLQCMLSTSNETYSLPETHFFCAILPLLKLEPSKKLSLDQFDQINQKLKSKMGLSWPESTYADLYARVRKKTLTALDLFCNILALYRPKSSEPLELRPIEKTPFHVFHMEDIQSCFPDALFINLVRDARDVVSSRMRMPTAIHQTPELYSEQWNRCVESAERFGFNFPDKIMTVRYENLVDKTAASLQRICQFLSLNFDQKMISNFSSQYNLCTLSNKEPWKEEVSIGKVIKKNGVWRDRIAKCEARKIEKITFNSMRAYGYQLEVRPIVIYQMGKVGSTSVYESLKALNLDSPIYHVHYLTESGIKRIGNKNVDSRKPRHLNESMQLRRLIDNRNKYNYWKIISFVRDPIARNISAFFQNISHWYPEIYSDAIPISTKIKNLVNIFLNNYPHEIPIEWFDEELKQVFSIDIFENDFPKDKGFKTYRCDKNELLLIRVEDLDKCATAALNTFLNINDFKLLKDNLAENKRYFEFYKLFKSQINLPEGMVEKIYNSKYAKHFYTPTELSSFISKWKRSQNLESDSMPRFKSKSNFSSPKPEHIREPYNIYNVLNLSSRYLKHYKDYHSGQRCVIIGNGPSLNNMDLSFLKDEITFGLNRIYLLDDTWDFTPTYYVSINPLVIEQSHEEISKIPAIKFLNYSGAQYFNNPENTIFLKSVPELKFSKNPAKGICEGYTVTYVAMQLAYYMGFSDVFLIGVDHNFSTSGPPNQEIISKGEDPNHFHPEYFGKGTRWQLPDLKNSEVYYKLAKQEFEKAGRRIFDATVDGKLNVFSKADYRNVFKVHNKVDQPLRKKGLSEKDPHQLYLKIEPLIEDGQFKLAVNALEKLLDVYPDFALAHNDLGVLYYQLGYYHRAQKHYEKAHQLQPENITFQKNLADFYYVNLNDVQAALQIYIGILKFHPNDIETLLTLSKICMDLENMDDAKEFLNRVIELDPLNTEAQSGLQQLKPDLISKDTEQAARATPDKTNSVAGRFLVSAIVSTYNAENLIKGCLDDLLNQTIADKLEIIVVNSGSEQNEEAIIKQFQKKHGNIKYLKTERCETLYEAWNRGIKMASGKYITNANTDDRHRRDALEILAKSLDNHLSAGLVYGDCLITENENETFEQNTANRCYIFPEFSRRQMLARQFFGPQPMWRKSVHDKIGYFNPQYVVSGDWDFFIRLAAEFDAIHISEFLGLYCRRHNSVERSNKDKNQNEQHEIYDKYRNAIPIEKIYPELESKNVDNDAYAAAYADLGNIFVVSSRDFQNARAAFEKGLRYKSDSIELLNNLALSFLYENRIDETQAIIETIKNNPDHTEKLRQIMQNFSEKRLIPENYALMSMPHPIINQLPPVQTGSLEYSLTEGKRIQVKQKPNFNFEVLKKFETAITEFRRGNFSYSEQLIQEYQGSVDYNGFARSDKRDNEQPMISVIIVSYSKNGELLECIHSVEKQSLTDFEIIVVDNGENSKVENALKEKNILYVKLPINFFPAEGRNIGAYFARGSIVAFLDDDATVHDNYISSISKAFETYKICGFRGKIIPKNHTIYNKDAGHYDLGDIAVPNSIDIEGNSAFLKAVYVDMKGMNPILFGSEGLEFSYRISKKYGAYATIYWPETIIYHDFAGNMEEYQNKLTRHDYSRKYLLDKFSDIYNYYRFLNTYSQNFQLANHGQSLISRN